MFDRTQLVLSLAVTALAVACGGAPSFVAADSVQARGTEIFDDGVRLLFEVDPPADYAQVSWLGNEASVSLRRGEPLEMPNTADLSIVHVQEDVVGRSFVFVAHDHADQDEPISVSWSDPQGRVRAARYKLGAAR